MDFKKIVRDRKIVAGTLSLLIIGIVLFLSKNSFSGEFIEQGNL